MNTPSERACAGCTHPVFDVRLYGFLETTCFSKKYIEKNNLKFCCASFASLIILSAVVGFEPHSATWKGRQVGGYMYNRE